MMKRFAVGLGVLAVGLLLSTAALGEPTGLDLSTVCGQPDDGSVIEVPPGDIETLYFHIDYDGGLWHVNDFELIIEGDPGGIAEVLDYDIQTSIEYTGCVWYKFGTIKVEGPYCTDFYITASVTVQLPTGTMTSNTIHKHIIPEPGTMLLLGTGLCGVLLLRRRRR